MSVLTHPLIANLTRCTGCKICELSCSFEKERILNPHLSRIKILKNDMLAVYIPTISMNCDLCKKCVNICPTGAIRFVEQDEAVLLRKKMQIEQFICPIVSGKNEMEVIRN